jgi:hypothetical protein
MRNSVIDIYDDHALSVTVMTISRCCQFSNRRDKNVLISVKLLSVLTFDGKEIPTGICMFSGSGNSVALLVKLYLETGSEKFKMAAPNRKYLISASIQDRKEIPTVI